MASSRPNENTFYLGMYVLNCLVCLNVLMACSPYRHIKTIDIWIISSLIIAAGVLIFDCVVYRHKVKKIVSLFSTVVPANLTVIIFDIHFRDPSGHNLLPFELVLFGLGSFALFSTLAAITALTIKTKNTFKT